MDQSKSKYLCLLMKSNNKFLFVPVNGINQKVNILPVNGINQKVYILCLLMESIKK